jgi:cytochrome c5
LAELYAAGCKPFQIASSNNSIEANKAEEARKKRFKIACAELTKDYPSSNKCHKGATGKHTYGKACEYICTKCGETGAVVP